MVTATHKDGLEVRRLSVRKFQVFDTLTNTYVGSVSGSRHWMQLALDERRKKFRPIIVRWIYGIPTADSIAQGVAQ